MYYIYRKYFGRTRRSLKSPVGLCMSFPFVTVVVTFFLVALVFVVVVVAVVVIPPKTHLNNKIIPQMGTLKQT